MECLTARDEPAGFIKPGRMVFTHATEWGDGHEAATHEAAARRIAALLDLPYGGVCDGTPPCARPYLIPRATLSGLQIRTKFALDDEGGLFGGWVPEDWMATKAIMHPLESAVATAPAGWMASLAEDAIPLTLRGFAAFSADDALTAGRRLLRAGPVRVKRAHADGGQGQFVARNETELARVIASISIGNILTDIVAIEENLEDVVTYSVGQVRLPGRVVSYFGTQSLTPRNDGIAAYGGSALFLVSGGFERLLARTLPEETGDAVRLAMAFDALADRHIPGFLASRRNYDIACGIAPDGTRRRGVLEQSWRMGGATGAEIAALEVFARNPHAAAVRASTVEIYGDAPEMPAAATLYFSGSDPHVGALTKYAVVEEILEG